MNAKSVTALAALSTLATGTVAHAAEASTHKVFISGPLILLFLGFCALVVVAQIIPVIATLYGMIKGLKESRKEVRAEAKGN